jgi:ABC-2 type transport system permease protein
MSAFLRESRFLLKQPFGLSLLLATLVLSSLALGIGVAESQSQKETIAKLKDRDQAERAYAIPGQSDFGSAAYYLFYLTYDAPGELAFAAMGVRHEQPWKHRIRMLALEGQIYENDTTNPELAYLGHLDFAFVIAFLTPLFLIMLLYDLRAVERTGGREALLIATSPSGEPWRSRALSRVCLFSVALLLPFIVTAVSQSVSVPMVLIFLAVCLAQIAFWSTLCFWISPKPYEGPTLLTMLVSFWLITTFVIPPMTDTLVERLIPAPTGGDIVLLQRETVNAAWDLPKEATMNPFLNRHPEWLEYSDVNQPFEWKWYFAFQQVGDQVSEDLSMQRQNALLRRDQLSAWLALLSPASLSQLGLTRLAETDNRSARLYHQRVRGFHASLREFYYPLIFPDVPYDEATFAEAPVF